MTAPIPIAELTRRIPVAGRIRTGAKTAKGHPTKLETFRFTSADRTAIDEIAAIYGGTPQQWKGGPTDDQWEVITEADEIAIALPPDPLGSTPAYELWSGGGRQRRCDGVTCEVASQTGPDTAELEPTSCICAAKGKLECKIIVRLFVLLPDIKFGGGWRLDTGSEYAARELPGMVDLIQSLQARGLTRGLLALEQRKKVAGGQTRRFAVPVLRVAGSLDALADGSQQVGSLGTAKSTPALAMSEEVMEDGAPMRDAAEQDAAELRGALAETVDAEIIETSATWDDDEGEALPPGPDEPGPQIKLDAAEASRIRATFMAVTKGLGLDYERDCRPWLVHRYGASWSEMADRDRLTLVQALTPDGSRADKEEAQARFKKTVQDFHAQERAS